MKRRRPLRHALRDAVRAALLRGPVLLPGLCLMLAQAPARAADLPVPCVSGTCGASGPSVWVTSGAAGSTIYGSHLDVQQQSDRAILNWASFDVAKDHSVSFTQPSSSAVALNRIYQQSPSQILGTVSANGQIYLINPNGIVFGKGAQVNVGAMVASTLDVSDEIFNGVGIARAVDQNQAALQGGADMGAIEVQDGAKLSAASGGRILIFAPQIDNAGSIDTPDGQSILAASHDVVYLQASDDPNLRGLLVEVGTGGDVRNVGKIVAERGNVTLMGLAVNQDGMVSATTTVSANGSVRLLAQDGGVISNLGGGRNTIGATHTGSVAAGADSVTQVTPELDDDASAVDEQEQRPSTIELLGRTVHLESGAQLLAAGGQVKMTATADPANPVADNTPRNDARVQLDAGSVVDVSGVDSVVLPMERNALDVELRANELADAPLQRDGPLRGQKVTIDVRKGTPLANVSGAIATVERSVGERLSTGGSVSIASEGDVILADGATIDVSGGQVRFEDGFVASTQVVSDGVIYDISEADPNRLYQGIADGYVKFHQRWGVTEIFSGFGISPEGRFEPGYIEGKDAGTLSIRAYDALLDGSILGQAVAGLHQRLPAAGLGGLVDFNRPYDQTPLGGRLVLDLAVADTAARDVVFANAVAPTEVPDTPLPDDRVLALATDMFASGGLTRFALTTNGAVRLPSGVTLTLGNGGALDLAGGTVEVDGHIQAHGGEVSLTGQVPGLTDAPVTLGAHSLIDVSGQWVNDSPLLSSSALPGSVFIDGGKVDVSARGSFEFAAGAAIDASAGAWLQDDGTLLAGRGGDVSLVSGLEGNDTAFVLDGDIRAQGLRDGGTLHLEANSVRIEPISTAAAPPAPGELVLHPDFFEHGGFSNFEIVANRNDFAIAPDTMITPRTENRLLGSDYMLRRTGADLNGFTTLGALPDFERAAASLSFALDQTTALTVLPGEFLVGAGARIRTDPRASVALASDRSLSMDGGIDAPAGAITVTLTLPGAATDPGFDPVLAIHLGDEASLLAPGAFVATPNDLGLRTGTVLPAGSVQLTALRGYIVTAPGSSIDVSGSAQPLDVVRATRNGNVIDTVPAVAPAGSIALTAAEGMLLNGALVGRAADAEGAAGGTLSLTMDGGSRNVDVADFSFGFDPRSIRLTSGRGPTIVAPGTAIPQAYAGVALLASEDVQAGGFDTLSLTSRSLFDPRDQTQPASFGTVQLDPGVDLELRRALVVNAPVIDVAGGADVRLDASYLRIGPDNVATQDLPAERGGGNGTLALFADLLEVTGHSLIDGVRAVTLASRGDLRLSGQRVVGTRELTGSLAVAGDLTLQADQIYPTTLSSFDVAVTADAGVLRILGGAAPKPVLSAGGALHLSAPEIEQSGVLKAPLGQIELVALDRLDMTAHAQTSTSTEGQLIPFGRTQGGIDWTYPFGDQTLLFDAPPAQRVRLQGDIVNLAAGSVIDVSGGGDLYAYEFVPGPGGSKDVLDPAGGSYAILPGLAPAYAPVDPLESPSSGLTPGDSLIIADGIAGLPAGSYALLPARYALLPGAFLVTPAAGTRDIVPGETLARLDGIPIVAGRYAVANTDIADSRWSGFAVETGAEVRTRAEYTDSYAGAFFAQRALDADAAAPRLPADAGTLTVAAGSALSLAGDLHAAAAAGGLGGRTDVQAEHIVVVGTPTGSSDAVELRADSLNALGVQSLLLGGTRSDDAEGTALDITASDVTVAADAHLSLPEVLLAARAQVIDGEVVGGTVSVQDDANGGGSITATAGAGARPARSTLHTSGDGALLVASSGDVSFVRDEESGAGGVLDVAAGAALVCDGALLLDASADTRLAGSLQVAGALTLGASRIGLGDAGDAFDGLALSVETLAALGVDALNLLSRSSIDLYGELDVAVGALTLDAAALVGHGAAGDRALLQADRVMLTNSGAALAAPVDSSGAGVLAIDAGELVLGAGAYALQGFAAASGVSLSASGDLIAQGAGTLTSTADLSLSAGRMRGENGAKLSIDAGNAILSVHTLAAPGAAAPDALGAAIALAGGNVSFGGNLALPGGRVTMTARTADGLADGDASSALTLESGAVIDVSGSERTFDDVTVAAPAGTVTLVADKGDVTIAAGAAVRMDGVGAADAGTLAIVVPKGEAVIAGDVSARAAANGSGRGGSFTLDAHDISDFTVLNASLNAAGMDEARSLRVRSGGLNVGANDRVRARHIALAADQGNVTIDGRLDASGTQGGDIALYAGKNVTVNNGAVLDVRASADGAHGGNVDMQSTDDDGAIRVRSGAQVLLAGGAGGAGGDLQLRAVQGTSPLDARIALGNGAVSGAATQSLEAVAVYEDADGMVDANDVSGYLNDAAAFMNSAPDFGPDLLVQPGIEVRASGALSLTAPVDLLSQRYAGQPGVLTLRAGGNLNVNADLSDGLLSGFDFFGNPLDSVQSGPSWSYRLVGGADLRAADALATAGGGNVTVDNDVTVRTGTGDIDVAAGGDIVLANAGATIYTAGESTGYGTLPPDITSFFAVDYPINGGDLNLHASGDIRGASTRQLITDWLHRLGGPGSSGVLPTVWGVNFADFAENVGALGGGDVSVDAGGDILNLSVSLPTTAQHQGDAGFDGTSFTLTDNRYLEQGGGNLDVRAGGDIRGGTYYVAKGTGTVRAGGDIIAPDASPLSLVLALGDAQFDVQAGGDLVLETALNPTVLPQSANQIIVDLVQSLFFTYSADAAVKLTSFGGDIGIHNDSADLARAIDLIFANLTAQAALTVYPGTMSAASMQGDLSLSGPFTLYPSAQGNLDLLAWQDVTTAGLGSVNINLSDTEPTLLPQPDTPAQFFNDARTRLSATGSSSFVHAATPVHLNDPIGSRVVAQTGSIDPPDDLLIYSAESLHMIAGQDIRNADLHVQNVAPDDLTLIQAGRDIVFTAQRGSQGEITPNTRTVEVAGPGQVQVVAGRNIDLGTSSGITTVGNQANAALADSGAALNVITGFTSQVDESGFRDDYLIDSDAHQAELEAYVQQLLGDDSLKGVAARNAFLALDAARQRPLLLTVLFDELRAAGVANATMGDDFTPGYAAIETLYPGSVVPEALVGDFLDKADLSYDAYVQLALDDPGGLSALTVAPPIDLAALEARFPGISARSTTDAPPFAGDLSLFFSRIQTFDGGDIDLVVPGGVVNAGLAASFEGAKAPSELGIVTQRAGSISAFVSDDFLVNQSRVFALDGGDILMWSSQGDIDAGRGAKSALAAPPPTVSFDANGNLVVEFPPAISGSGIRAAVSTPGRDPGDVFLFAPAGIVNAGDAGIGSAGNITIAATEVVGAENIDVGGVAVGVPVDTGGIAAALSGVSSVGSSASKSAEQTATAGAREENAPAPLAEAALGWLDVFVLGFGEEGESAGSSPEEKKKKGEGEQKEQQQP